MKPAPAINPTHEQLAATAKQIELIKISSLTGGVQLRAGFDNDTIVRYAEIYKLDGGASFPPIVVFRDGEHLIIADGHHRLGAAKLAKRSEIAAIVKTGDIRAATEYALESNHDHGLPLTNADKRAMVKVLLEDEHWASWADREIARRCRVSPTFVGQLRATSPTAATITKRKDKHGVERKTKNQQTQAPPTGVEPETMGPSDVDAGESDIKRQSDDTQPIKQAPLQQRRRTWMREHIAARLSSGKVGSCSLQEAAALALIVGLNLGSDVRWSTQLIERAATYLIEVVAGEVARELKQPTEALSRLPDLPDLCRIYKIDHDALVINAERTVTE